MTPIDLTAAGRVERDSIGGWALAESTRDKTAS